MQEIAGPLGGINIAIVGDPRMRAVRSLLELLARQPPATVSVIADPEHAREVRLPHALQAKARFTSWESLEDVDVLYVAGIPHAALPLARREALLATAARVERLPAHSILLSPMPVIDEIAREVRFLPCSRIYEQSDLGLFVRMAILEHVVRDA
jgi:aspartate carbamoyltransferase catalytic subunit